MFEQSFLLEDEPGKRTRALAASLTIQLLAVCVLLLIPLIYSDRLPAVQPWISVAAPLPRAPLEPQQVKVATQPGSRPSILPSRPFPLSVSMSIPQLREQGFAMISSDGLPSMSTAGSPFEVPIASSFPRIIAEAPPHPAATIKEPDGPRRVGGDVQSAKLIRKVVPAYPPLAKQARVSGTVHLIGVIAKDGSIQQLQVLSGHSLLIAAALDAVRQWLYKPTLLNEEAVEVIAPIDVTFTLSQ
jgi:protein TonB